MGKGVDRGARISEFFFTKNQNLKIKTFFFGGTGLVDRWVAGRTDEQAQTNLPLQHLRSWGHNNA